MSKKKQKKYELLIHQIEDNLIPHFISLGFNHVPLSAEDKKTEMKFREPFGCLKRKHDKGIDLVEILFCGNQLSHFVIDFGVAPNDGITLPWGHHLNVDQVHVSALDVSYQLSSSSLRAKPFGFKFLSQVTEESAHQIIRDIILYKIEEIENWFKYQKKGKFIRVSA